MKLAVTILSVLLVLVTGVAIYLYVSRPGIPSHSTTTNTYTYHYYYQDRKDSVDAVIDTVNVPGGGLNVMAYYRDHIKKDKVQVDLDIAFNKTTDKFNVLTGISGTVDTVKTTETITYYKDRKVKFISPVFSGYILQDINDPKNRNIQIGAGARLFDRIDVVGLANTNKQIGFGLTYRY